MLRESVRGDQRQRQLQAFPSKAQNHEEVAENCLSNEHRLETKEIVRGRCR